MPYHLPRYLTLWAACGLSSCVDATTVDTDTSPSSTSAGTGDATAGQSGAAMTSGDTGAPDSTVTSTSPDEPGTSLALDDSTTTGAADTGTDGSTTADTDTTLDGPVCGDGVVDPGEACDDANTAEDDGCLADCMLGPGGALPPLSLEPLAEKEFLRCFTAIDASRLGGDAHALVLGSEILGLQFDDPVTAHVRRLPLPDAAPAAWTYLEHAEIYGRRPHRAITAENGDVIVVGAVFTETLKPDSGGYSWRARFAPDGALVWNHEDELLFVVSSSVALTPQGDFVVAGVGNAFGAWSVLRLFGPDGALKAEFSPPDPPGYFSEYVDVAADDDGNIYLLGTHVAYDNSHSRVFLYGLSPDASLQWSAELDSATHPHIDALTLVRTTDDVLLAAIKQHDHPKNWKAAGPLAFAAFTADGTELWWKEWSPPEPWHPLVGTLVADDVGGAYLAGTLVDGDAETNYLTRLSGGADPQWLSITPGEAVVDALLGPDGLFYVLTHDAIVPHLP